ncbi:MAG: protein phosphatase 2C domain-containing protein [Fusobacterium sp.]|mgnify:FL=1|uniref:protein phosphatase 2C domain-containing protein n=1 Tax=Fusobacterium sp. TaxID=68766 RepID=UPI00399B1356
MNNILNEANKLKSGVKRAENDIKKVKSLIPTKNEEAQSKEQNKETGRKAESKFITSFVSRIGRQAINCDYFGYIELPDFAIWALADGYDEEKGGEEASKIAVEEVISLFMEKPRLSKRFLQKIILKAHNKVEDLRGRSREKRGMSASLVVFITDYTSMIYGNVGNARLYLIRDDIVIEKTVDHSIAHMLYEANQLDYKEIRFHSQRNKLTQAMGEIDGIKPYISKRVQLYDGDRILLLSHGAWENLDESEIEVELSKTDKVGIWIGALENKLKDNSDTNIPNYTLAGIFINQVSPTGKKKSKINYMKYLIISLIIVGFGFFLYKGYSLKKERDITYERAYQYENEGLKYVENGNFEEALEYFEKSKNEYTALEISPKEANIVYRTIFSPKITNINLGRQMLLVDKKIEQIGVLQEILSDVNEADKLYNANDFIVAEDKYREAKGKIPQLKDLKYKKIDEISSKIDDSITACKGLAVAYDMKLEGDELLEQDEIEGAIRNYLEAKLVFLKFNKIDLLAEVTEKAERLAKSRERKYDRALMYEKKAYEIESSDINGAIVYLEMAKGIYSELRDEARRLEIEERILSLAELRNTLIKENKAYLNEARAYADGGEYERALSIIKKSQDISVQLKDNQKLTDSIQEEGDLFLSNRKYQLAYEKYSEAYSISVNTNNKLQQEYLQGRIETLKKYLSINKDEKKADNLFKEEKYKEARNLYKELKEKYKVLEGDKYFEKENYDILMQEIEEKYKKAKKKASWISFL